MIYKPNICDAKKSANSQYYFGCIYFYKNRLKLPPIIEKSFKKFLNYIVSTNELFKATIEILNKYG